MDKLDKSFWLVAAISVIIVFFNLGGLPLLDPDEPVYAETPKEMIAFNDYISPRIYGEYWYDKPPMYYWLVAGSFKLFGVNEFAARFPSAFLGVICILSVYFFAAKLFSRETGVASALVLATSIEYFYLTKAAVTDITLLLFLSLSLLCFLDKKYYSMYIFAGLATVTKGPIGFLFPGGIIFMYLLATRSFAQLKKMKLGIGIVLYALFALPWYGAMYSLHGSAFVDTFLGFHNITRFTSPEHPEGVLWYYFIPVLILGFFPWTAILVQSVWTSLTDSRTEEYRKLVFLNIWAWFIFLFFTVSRTKLVSYILPMYPPLAIIAGWYLARMWEGRRFRTRNISWPVMLTLLTGVFAAGMFFGLDTMPELTNGVIAVAMVFAAMLLAVWYFFRQREYYSMFLTKVACMLVFSMVLVTMLFPVAAPQFASKQIADDFAVHYDRQSPVYIIKFLHPGFTFYSGVYGKEVKDDKELLTAIRASKRAYFVIRQSEYKRLTNADRDTLSVLAESADKILLLKQ